MLSLYAQFHILSHSCCAIFGPMNYHDSKYQWLARWFRIWDSVLTEKNREENEIKKIDRSSFWRVTLSYHIWFYFESDYKLPWCLEKNCAVQWVKFRNSWIAPPMMSLSSNPVTVVAFDTPSQPCEVISPVTNPQEEKFVRKLFVWNALNCVEY